MTDPDMTHQLLHTIKQTSSAEAIYQFLIDDLQTQIKAYALNTRYWKNQVHYIEERGVYESPQEKQQEMKEYQSLIKGNKKCIRHFKKSIKNLQRASKQNTKGEHHE